MFWVRRCWINKKSLSFKIVKMNYPFGVLLRIEHPLGTTVQPTPERRHWRSGRVKATAYTLAYSLRTGNNQHCSTLPRHWSLPFFSQHTPAAAGNIACQGLTKPQSWYKLSCLCSGDRDKKRKTERASLSNLPQDGLQLNYNVFSEIHNNHLAWLGWCMRGKYKLNRRCGCGGWRRASTLVAVIILMSWFLVFFQSCDNHWTSHV